MAGAAGSDSTSEHPTDPILTDRALRVLAAFVAVRFFRSILRPVLDAKDRSNVSDPDAAPSTARGWIDLKASSTRFHARFLRGAADTIALGLRDAQIHIEFGELETHVRLLYDGKPVDSVEQMDAATVAVSKPFARIVGRNHRGEKDRAAADETSDSSSTYDEVESFDYLGLTRTISLEILRYVQTSMPHVPLQDAIDSFRAAYTTISGEQFMVPYEISWEANPARSTMGLSNPANWTEAHCDLLVRERDVPHASTYAAMQAIACVSVPAHEIVHFVQHHHGKAFGSKDPDTKSYSAEHDASRLSLSIMWQVLRRPGLRDRLPPWFPDMCVAFELDQAANYIRNIKAVGSGVEISVPQGGVTSASIAEGGSRDDRAAAPIAEDPSAKPLAGVTSAHETVGVMWAAYRNWTSSFGMDTPSTLMEKLKTSNTIDSSFKGLVAIEALVEDEKDLLTQMGLAFHKERKGDVYSESNRRLVLEGLPDRLRVADDGPLERVMAPAGEETVDEMLGCLRKACDSSGFESRCSGGSDGRSVDSASASAGGQGVGATGPGT